MELRLFTSVSGRISASGKERKRMSIADSRALLADIMDIVDEHVTAKASKELEKRILDVWTESRQRRKHNV
jgi:hypothetical protein